MASRLELHEEFCNILDSRNAYFQPPASVKLEYDCIKYSLSGINVRHANNGNYMSTNQYEVIVITRKPDSKIPGEILNRFKMCRFDRAYVADNLNHFVFTLYY